MVFPYFFLVGSTLLLVTTLLVIRKHDRRLKPFGLAGSLTAVLLLAGAVLRLIDPAADPAGPRLLVDAVTVANLSATSILLIAWTARLRRSTG